VLPARVRPLLPFYLGLLLVAGLLAERLAMLARAAPTDFDGKLLAEGEVLCDKVSTWPEASAQCAKGVESEGEHRVEHARSGRGAVPSPWLAD
jgi:hypothetical protein